MTGCRRSSPPPASPTSSRSCSKGHEAAGKTFKVHIDGFNLLPYLTGARSNEPAPGLHLLQRRRRPGRAPLRQLEAGVHGAAVAGHARGVGGAVHRAARPEDVQPPHRSVRARRRRRRTPTGTGTSSRALHDPARPRRSSGEFLATFKEFPPRQKAASFTDRAGDREDAGLDRRRARLMADALSSWNDSADEGGHHRLRRARHDLGSRTPCRPRSGSPSSTTTARSGPRSRCRRARCSSSSGSGRWLTPTRRCASASRGRRLQQGLRLARSGVRQALRGRRERREGPARLVLAAFARLLPSRLRDRPRRSSAMPIHPTLWRPFRHPRVGRS